MPNQAHIPPSQQQVTVVDMVAPGSLGLNLEQESNIISYKYATVADNFVVDSSGRLGNRLGFSVNTTTPIGGSPAIKTIAEYIQGDRDQFPIIAYNGGISTSISNPAGSDISGSVTDTDGRWVFLNFNSKFVGLQAGQKPIVYTGSGSFATVSEASGTAPDGGIGTSAYGRLWIVDGDLQTIQYSALLDETHWSTGAGQIDMRNIWTQGMDSVTAIAAFNGALVVFGRRHIVFFIDGQQTALGVDPTKLYVSDVIAGTGAVSDLTLQYIGESDLIFVSPEGVQSLARVIQERSNPLVTLSKYVRTQFLEDLAGENVANIRTTYSPLERFYIVSFPTRGRTWVFGDRYQDADGDVVATVTTWTIAPTALMTVLQGTTTYFGGTYGVATYGGKTDNGDNFRVKWTSPWLDLGEDYANQLKLLKRYGAILFVSTNASIVFKFWGDFKADGKSLSREVMGDAQAEYGIAEFGEDEFSGGLSLRQFDLPARMKAQYFRLGIEADITGTFAIQQTELYAKIGRLA